MRFSIKIFTWLKIPVFLHWSFGLILLYAGYIAYSNNLGYEGAFWITGAFLTIFSCVLLHEYGHAMAARRYGIHTRDIILTPIGGIARLEGMPEKPEQELVVAIAGPLVNVAIVLVLVVFSALFFGMDSLGGIWDMVLGAFSELIQGSPESVEALEETNEAAAANPSMALELLGMLITSNCFLFAFNLIPAFPMDGGRVLRALLEMGSNKLQATKIAAFIGQIIALGFIYFGFKNEPHTTALIGVFIFFAARNEYRDLLRRHILETATVANAMFTNLPQIDGRTPMPLVLQQMAKFPQKQYVFVTDSDLGRVLGVIDSEFVQHHPDREDETMLIGNQIQPFYTTISRESKLKEFASYFEWYPNAVLAVANPNTGQIEGIIVRESFFQAMSKA